MRPRSRTRPRLDPTRPEYSLVTPVQNAGVVVVFGTVCLDRTRRVAHLPMPGQYVEVESESTRVGGEAANTAIALRRWGAEPLLAGNAVGSALERRFFEVRGLDLGHTPVDDEATPVCDIYVTPEGERTMFGHRFRGLFQRAPNVPHLGPGDWLTTDANLGLASLHALAEARSQGASTYALDAGLGEGLTATVWQSSTDNVGYRGDIQRNLELLGSLLGSFGGLAILSDAANGFVAGGTMPGGGRLDPRHFAPFPCPTVADSTGAGDVFRAGMLLGLDEGWPMADALRFASAAGCLNCTREGASEDVPSRTEVLGHIAASPGIARSYEV